jgi:transposase
MDTVQILAQHYADLLELQYPWVVEEIKTDHKNEKITIRVAFIKGEKPACPVCKKPCIVADHRERSFRHLNVMQYETLVLGSIPRTLCPEHGVKTVSVPWAEKYSHYTYRFERYAIDIMKVAENLSEAKRLLRLSWDQVSLIQNRAVERGLARRGAEPIKLLGIDEKSFLRGHDYASIIADLDQARVLDLVRGRKLADAEKLLNKIPGKQRETIEAVAMDMLPAFMTAVKNKLPKADIVHDKFHMTAYLTKAVDQVRRREHTALSKQGIETLTGSKYLWLTNPKNFSKKNKKEFRAFALEELQVGKAWTIKESFRRFWAYSNRMYGYTFFNSWYFWATHSRLTPVVDAAKTLKRHREGLLNYFTHRVTNAGTEGLNSRIQSIKARARGFRNFDNYRIAILFYLGKLDLYPDACLA